MPAPRMAPGWVACKVWRRECGDGSVPHAYWVRKGSRERVGEGRRTDYGKSRLRRRRFFRASHGAYSPRGARTELDETGDMESCEVVEDVAAAPSAPTATQRAKPQEGTEEAGNGGVVEVVAAAPSAPTATQRAEPQECGSPGVTEDEKAASASTGAGVFSGVERCEASAGDGSAAAPARQQGRVEMNASGCTASPPPPPRVGASSPTAAATPVPPPPHAPAAAAPSAAGYQAAAAPAAAAAARSRAAAAPSASQKGRAAPPRTIASVSEEERRLVLGVGATLTRMAGMASAAPVKQLTCFHSSAPPPISIGDYVKRIHGFFGNSKSCYVLGLLYIDWVMKRYPSLSFGPLTAHRLMIAGILVATKFHDDDVYYSNAFYAKVGGLTLKELNLLENCFLQLLGYRLYVTEDEYRQYEELVLRAAALEPKV